MIGAIITHGILFETKYIVTDGLYPSTYGVENRVYHVEHEDRSYKAEAE